VGRWAGEREEERGRLGRAMQEEGEGKEKGRLGCVVWKKKKKGERRWAGPKVEKEREKKKCIQMHLNLKFKFNWKTSNETMQCGMKCTRPIFTYISFYG
jgi:hypothetical protein